MTIQVTDSDRPSCEHPPCVSGQILTPDSRFCRGDHCACEEDDALLRDGHLRNDARGNPCPKCGFTGVTLPAWIQLGARFRLGDEEWRVTGIARTNLGSRDGAHFRDIVYVKSPSGEDGHFTDMKDCEPL